MMQKNEANPYHRNIPFYGLTRRIVLYISIAILISCAPTTTFASARNSNEGFEEVINSYMEKVLNEYHVAGAAVAVVKDGETLFCKGYGYADLENKTLIDGETTAFQIASVTKLFTATAVMQMVERGELDLDTDINQYLLAFQIENSYKTPVTLRHLLTHTSGLDDQTPLYKQSSGDVLFSDIESLESTMKKYLPPVVREPGSYCQYSVMGMALAGYLVETVSGVPFDIYVTQNILAPLGMVNSSYGLTGSILPTASRSFRYAKGEYVQSGYTLNSNHPSGAIFSSAGDMAKFMQAHLSEKNSILSSTGLTAMHTHQFPEDERLTGYSLGFYETIRNGHRTIEHGGYLPRFSSKLTLLPEQNIGMFVVLNTDSPGSGKVCNEFVDLFYSYFTDKVSGNNQTLPFDLDSASISGLYAMEGYGLKNSTKLKAQLITSRVDCDSSGNLHYAGELALDFQYIGNGMFYSKDSGNYCRVSQHEGEWILNILGSDRTKVNLGERALFLIYIASQPFFLGMLLIQVIFLIRKKQTTVGLIAAIISLINFVFLSAVVSMPILTLTGNTEALLTIILPVLPFIGWLFLLVTVTLTVFIIYAWRQKLNKLTGLIAYTAFCPLALFSLVFIITMNGLG